MKILKGMLAVVLLGCGASALAETLQERAARDMEQFAQRRMAVEMQEELTTEQAMLQKKIDQEYAKLERLANNAQSGKGFMLSQKSYEDTVGKMLDKIDKLEAELEALK